MVQQNDVTLSKFAYWKSRIVGAICTRITEPLDEEEAEGGPKLYIMTLAVYAAYRGRRIGSRLLQSVLDRCEELGVQSISLHVHVSNHDAIRFYTQRFGFEQGELLKNYYRRVNPPDCYLLSKTFETAESVDGSAANNESQEPLQPPADTSASLEK